MKIKFFIYLPFVLLGCNQSQTTLGNNFDNNLENISTKNLPPKDKKLELNYDIIGNIEIDSLQNNSNSNLPDKKIYLNDTCQMSNTISKHIKDFLKGQNPTVFDRDFLLLLKDNSTDTTDCFFPRNSDEQLLLFNFTDSLVNSLSENKVKVAHLLISLNLYNSQNIEYSEYGQEVIPAIALQDTENFIKALSNETKENQDIIIEYLDFLKSIENVNLINKNLKEINSKRLEPVVERVQLFMEEAFSN